MILATSVSVSAADHPVPTDAAGAPRENVGFWYQPITPTTDLTPLGHPRVVVHYDRKMRSAEEHLAVDRIHSVTGASAYRYVQLYYLPAVRRSMSVRIGRHPRWSFCRSGNTPATDTTVKPAQDRWMLVDANERPVVAAYRALLMRIRRWGWDGIFLDLAHRAFTQDVWDRASTCEHDPVVPGRPSADAYAALVPIARSMGLQVMVNAGAPSGVPTPLRPDPGDPACRAADWAHCRGLDDVARAATWILHEGSSNQPADATWSADTAALTADELANRRPGHATIVGFGAYRGDTASRIDHTAYQWSLMKLYAVPAAFGTGTDRCGTPPGLPMDPECNRGGIAPAALVDTTLGPPLDPAPLARSCRPDGWHCLWIRRYRDGLVALDNTPGPLTASHVAIATGPGCATVTDVLTGATEGGGGCVSTVDITLAGFRAQVLSYTKRTGT